MHFNVKLSAAKIALLAPVPLEHLIDGRKVVEAHGKVAFGSQMFELFRLLDLERKGQAVDVYIYASHHERYPDGEIYWRARYIGHVESDLGAHPSGMKFRPASTGQHSSDNKGYWAVFWEVDALRAVPSSEWCDLAELTGYGKKKPYGQPFVPEGPLLVERPPS